MGKNYIEKKKGKKKSNIKGSNLTFEDPEQEDVDEFKEMLKKWKKNMEDKKSAEKET